MSRVAITGASGLVGGNLAAELLEAGHEVVATKRAGTKIAHLDDLAIEWRDGDLKNGASLARAFAGCDAVFHCAAAVGVEKEVTPEMRDTNVGGTQRVIDACVEAGVKRLVHTSSVVAIGLTTTGVPSDETARWNFDKEGLVDAYAITKHEAEEVVRKAAAGALDAVIVNPTYMFGPRDARPSSGTLIIKIAKRRVPGWTPGYNNFVDVRDVARGMIAAWQKGTRGERYILGGHDMTYKACFETIAKVAGVRPPRLGVPYPLAKLLGRFGDILEARGREAIVNSTQIEYAFTDKFRFRSTKAASDLGYTYGPLEPAIRDALAWFRKNDML
ncbi:MAG TPA: SDR family oxidoreductase [Kofleriaceae bacterium]|nr:SDR family oxidoreductase [Kofleriaceae bacterium]